MQRSQVIKDWNYLQTSDHFYYMCTKFFSDGDVHKYFNHYSTPYDAYINYMNVLSDFEERVKLYEETQRRKLLTPKLKYQVVSTSRRNRTEQKVTVDNSTWSSN